MEKVNEWRMRRGNHQRVGGWCLGSGEGTGRSVLSLPGMTVKQKSQRVILVPATNFNLLVHNSQGVMDEWIKKL